MKSAVMMVLAMSIAIAQAPAPVVSPEVTADRHLTLRYRAPDAKQVTVTGELDGQPHPLTKGPDGVWSVTLGPLDGAIVESERPRKAACDALPIKRSAMQLWPISDVF